MIKVVQVTLKNEFNEVLNTWVDKPDKIKVGGIVRLKDYRPDDWWRVMAVYDEILKEEHQFDWHRKWTNNI